MTDVNQRMDRMEVKLDKLIDAVTELVRLETKIANHSDALQRYGHRLDEHGIRLHEIEVKVPLYDDRLHKGNWMNRIIVTILITGAVTSLVVFN